jgi:GNAT superfamily N-acetyltransferase
MRQGLKEIASWIFKRKNCRPVLFSQGYGFVGLWIQEESAGMNWRKNNFTISSEKERVDIDALYGMLSQSYWAKGRTREQIEQTVSNSICFSLFKDEEQIGFARVLTDRVAYAVILDMIIRDDFRGQGLGKWLMGCIFEHPEIALLRQVLWTTDADDFYRKLGFQERSKLKFMARSW